ncbi:hypothetical protein [Sorangium sp. So ce1389]|uniref:hypothetical protein n=1 Tax=Sorangium sp. So ce1389 TaxID=3133336 RepID=UPI003F622F62
MERFLDEARATARCRHENIVVIHEVDEIRGYPYLVLEYVKGRSLREWMVQRGRPGPLGSPAASAPPDPMSPRQVIGLVIPVVRALGCAHELGIVQVATSPRPLRSRPVRSRPTRLPSQGRSATSRPLRPASALASPCAVTAETPATPLPPVWSKAPSAHAPLASWLDAMLVRQGDGGAGAVRCAGARLCRTRAGDDSIIEDAMGSDVAAPRRSDRAARLAARASGQPPHRALSAGAGQARPPGSPRRRHRSG